MRVKSREEIEETLAGGKLHIGSGLCFTEGMIEYCGKVVKIARVDELDGTFCIAGYWWPANWVEPVEEPRELDLYELLEGCEGIKLYSPICGEVTLVSVSASKRYGIKVACAGHNITAMFARDGRYTADCPGECLLWPSKDVRTWDGWNSQKAKSNAKIVKLEAEIEKLKSRISELKDEAGSNSSWAENNL